LGAKGIPGMIDVNNIVASWTFMFTKVHDETGSVWRQSQFAAQNCRGIAGCCIGLCVTLVIYCNSFLFLGTSGLVWNWEHSWC